MGRDKRLQRRAVPVMLRRIIEIDSAADARLSELAAERGQAVSDLKRVRACLDQPMVARRI